MNKIRKELLNMIKNSWDACVMRVAKDENDTLLKLPYPYITPCKASANFFQEMYYWDSYFAALGLSIQNRHDIIQNTVENMIYCINKFGFIPNGNRTYYLGRSQPPYFSCLVRMVYDHNRDKSWFKVANDALKKEYQFWTSPPRITDTGLSHYFDTKEKDHKAAECESGWDFTPRFADVCADVVPIDLNCLLFLIESTLSDIADEIGDKDGSYDFKKKMDRRWEEI